MPWEMKPIHYYIECGYTLSSRCLAWTLRIDSILFQMARIIIYHELWVGDWKSFWDWMMHMHHYYLTKIICNLFIIMEECVYIPIHLGFRFCSKQLTDYYYRSTWPGSNQNSCTTAVVHDTYTASCLPGLPCLQNFTGTIFYQYSYSHTMTMFEKLFSCLNTTQQILVKCK